MTLPEHGTTAGHAQHLAAGERPCESCRAARRLYSLAWEDGNPTCTHPVGCLRPQRAKGFCSTHWRWVRDYGIDGHPPTRSDIFWAQVELGPTSIHSLELGPCWIWTGPIGSKGYGKFARPGGPAHVFAYRDMIGEIPAGYTIDHLCMVKLCVNPYHLDPVPRGVNARRYWDHFRALRSAA